MDKLANESEKKGENDGRDENDQQSLEDVKDSCVVIPEGDDDQERVIKVGGDRKGEKKQLDELSSRVPVAAAATAATVRGQSVAAATIKSCGEQNLSGQDLSSGTAVAMAAAAGVGGADRLSPVTIEQSNFLTLAFANFSI